MHAGAAAHGTGATKVVLEVWWAVAGAVLSLVATQAEVTSELRVQTWLLHASSGSGIARLVALASLVDSCLELFKEAVNILEIVLCASVWQRKRVSVSSDAAVRATTAAAHAASVAERVEEAGGIEAAGATAVSAAVVVTSVVATAADGERKCVALLESVSNIVVAAWVDRATLDISQKVVERLDRSSPSVHALNVGECGAVWVVDGAVAGVLGAGLLWVGAAVGTIWNTRLVGWVWVAHRVVAAGAVVGGCWE